MPRGTEHRSEFGPLPPFCLTSSHVKPRNLNLHGTEGRNSSLHVILYSIELQRQTLSDVEKNTQVEKNSGSETLGFRHDIFQACKNVWGKDSEPNFGSISQWWSGPTNQENASDNLVNLTADPDFWYHVATNTPCSKACKDQLQFLHPMAFRSYRPGSVWKPRETQQSGSPKGKRCMKVKHT